MCRGYTKSLPDATDFFTKGTFYHQKVSHAAKSLGAETYLIERFVRDKILNRPCKDIDDVVCVGDGIVLAEEVTKQFLPGPAVNFFKTYSADKHFVNKKTDLICLQNILSSKIGNPIIIQERLP